MNENSNTRILMFLAVLLSGSSCLDRTGEAIEWNSVKSGIRVQFPTVNQLSTQELASWLLQEDAPRPLLLDTRTREEFAVSHLFDAILVSSEEETFESLKGFEHNQPLVVYCSVGYRSSRIAEILAESGYTNVYNLEGSIFQWANEGRAVYRGSEPVEVVHPYDDSWGQLLNRELWSFGP